MFFALIIGVVGGILTVSTQCGCRRGDLVDFEEKPRPGVISHGKLGQLVYNETKRRWVQIGTSSLALPENTIMQVSTVTGHVNDLKIGNMIVVVWWDGDADLDLGGIGWQDGGMSGQDGQIIYIANATQHRTIRLIDDDIGSIAAMRFSVEGSP